MEDMNAVEYVASYMTAYLYQEGIPEYDAATTYYINSIVKNPSTLQLYGSLTNGNSGNALTSAANWRLLIDFNNLPSSGGSFKNLKAAWASNTTLNMTADNATVAGGSGVYQIASPAVTINSATSGANGLDSGAVAASTWYYLHLIYNPTTTTVAGLMSLSATAPTLPSGYTALGRFGSVRTDGSAHFIGFVQYNRRVQYAVGNNLSGLPIMASGQSGNTGTPTWTAVAVTSFVPPTASGIKLVLFGIFAGPEVMAAPNNSYGAYPSTTNPPPLVIANSVGSASGNSLAGEFALESSNVYYAAFPGGGGSAAAAGMACMGWEDNL
jgi:hypothetical protein